MLGYEHYLKGKYCGSHSRACGALVCIRFALRLNFTNLVTL